jgi:hypothetical protein
VQWQNVHVILVHERSKCWLKMAVFWVVVLCRMVKVYHVSEIHTASIIRMKTVHLAKFVGAKFILVLIDNYGMFVCMCARAYMHACMRICYSLNTGASNISLLQAVLKCECPDCLYFIARCPKNACFGNSFLLVITVPKTTV